MATTFDEIRRYFDAHFPAREQIVVVRNCTDTQIETSQRVLHQFIVGVTPKDPLSNGIEHYEHRIKEQLSPVSGRVKCLAWGFRGYEVEEMKSVLEELSEYFEMELELDIDTMVGRLKIKKDSDDLYYIVITVVQYPVIYVD